MHYNHCFLRYLSFLPPICLILKTGFIAETEITPVASLLDLETDIRNHVKRASDLPRVVVLKLNGGLGTSMGLDKAKSLLAVKDSLTFLDFTALQVLKLREKHPDVNFILMNSFSTSDDSMSYVAEKHPSLVAGHSDPKHLELMQNKVPKVRVDNLMPAEYPENPQLEWCPPGHGDLYSTLYDSGKLQQLLDDGIQFMFVSNVDNLGATLDLDLLTYFAHLTTAPFMMECLVRSENDKKGGHLAMRSNDGQLILRESAQCSSTDKGDFENINKHKYFNTNNLWIRLDSLKVLMEANRGFVPLPTIFNKKTVNPQDGASTQVLQLETAMGSALECFKGAIAVCVSKDRFAPVKKCSDLLLLRSDAYIVNGDSVLELHPSCNHIAPIINLDDNKYKLVPSIEAATVRGVPSLLRCTKLTIEGEVHFSSNVVFVGVVQVNNKSPEAKLLPGGVYENTTVTL